MSSFIVNSENLVFPPLLRRFKNISRQYFQATGRSLRLLETWRSPERQQDLYDIGRTKRGKHVTNAKPWDSMHQYGLAIDIIGDYDNILSNGRQRPYDVDWELVGKLAAENDVTWGGEWRDYGHLEMTAGLGGKYLRQLIKKENSSILNIWHEVSLELAKNGLEELI